MSAGTGVKQMAEKKDRMDRRGFLSSIIKTGALLTAGAAILGGGCKCGDEDIDWSDEGGDEPAPKPEDKGGKKKEPAPKSNAGA